jgi:hypothetical protein
VTLLLRRTGVISSTRYVTTGGGGGGGLAEADWLMTCVASDGAIRQTPGDTYVLPYMSNYACLGLARAYEITHNGAYLTAAKNWCLWYAGHMDPSTGYVKDVRSSSGTATDWTPSTSGLSADSTDAYAGMFLTALYMTYVQDQGSWIDPITGSIALALTAIESTQQPDGLTWALPTYTVKYLEDNLETLIGLQSASTLAYFLGETAVQARAEADRTKMSAGMGGLWNYETSTWDWALHENDGFQVNDWSDAGSRQQQAWALGWGAMPPNVGGGQALYDAYNAAAPDWDTQTGSYEILPSWALELLGDTAAQATANAHLQTKIDAAGHHYPYTCGTSGQFIIALNGRSGLPTAEVTFPDGVNLLPNPDFALDSNSDGIADGVSNYANPTMSLISTTPAPSQIQQMVTPGGMDMHWDPIAVTPGQLYVFSFYRKITASDPGCKAVIKIDFPGTPHYNFTVTDPGIIDGDFVRWWQIARAPEGATTAACEIGTDGSGGMTIQVKEAKMEAAGCSPTPFVYPPHLLVVDHYADLNLLIDTPAGRLVWDNTGFDAASDAGGSVGHDGWLYFSPSSDCTATFDTFGSGPQVGGGSADTHLRIYQNLDSQTSAIGGLMLLAESDDDNGAHSSVGSDASNAWLQVSLQANVLYFVQVGAHSSHQPSSHMVLNWSGIEMTATGPSHQRNDNLLPVGFNSAQSQVISGAGQDVPFSNWDYTTESFETGIHMYRSAWYTFVPDSSGPATLDTSLVVATGHTLLADSSAAQTDTYLRLYTGPATVTAFSDLTQVAADDDSGGSLGQSALTYTVTAGQHYYVQASMYRDTYWNDRFALRWALPVAPPAPPTSISSGQDVVFDTATAGLTQWVLEFDMHPMPGSGGDGHSILEWGRSADGSTRHAYYASNNFDDSDYRHNFYPAEDVQYVGAGENTEPRHVKIVYRPTDGAYYIYWGARYQSLGTDAIDAVAGATRIRFAPVNGVTFTNITLVAYTG